jgi:hypothetical protein
MAMLSDQEQDAPVEQARRGDPEAINRLFSQERARLRRMVELRLDDRLRGRVDASDVIQEAQLAVFVRLPDFLARPSMPFWVWLRLEVGRHLVLVHRQHLGTAMRDLRREVPLHAGTMPPPSSTALAFARDGRELTTAVLSGRLYRWPLPKPMSGSARDCQRRLEARLGSVFRKGEGVLLAPEAWAGRNRKEIAAW